MPANCAAKQSYLLALLGHSLRSYSRSHIVFAAQGLSIERRNSKLTMAGLRSLRRWFALVAKFSIEVCTCTGWLRGSIPRFKRAGGVGSCVALVPAQLV